MAFPVKLRHVSKAGSPHFALLVLVGVASSPFLAAAELPDFAELVEENVEFGRSHHRRW